MCAHWCGCVCAHICACVHVCMCSWASQGATLFFSSFFPPVKGLIPSRFTKFDFKVMRILLHISDSFMFLRPQSFYPPLGLSVLLWVLTSLVRSLNHCWESYGDICTHITRDLAITWVTFQTLGWWYFGEVLLPCESVKASTLISIWGSLSLETHAWQLGSTQFFCG